jgi:hypothetical protein
MRPVHQEVQEQTEERCDQHAPKNDNPLVELADLLLSGDGTLLKLQGLLRHTSVLSQVLALSVPNLLQQFVSHVVRFHRSLRCRLNTGDKLRSSDMLGFVSFILCWAASRYNPEHRLPLPDDID